ncbi:MAG: CHAP domain-containing protein [Saprospiraceae bacterium]
MKRIILFVAIIGIGIAIFFIGKNAYFGAKHPIGEPIDTFNNVIVYYNGSTRNVLERNTTKDSYNLGLKYQCVEFVKRYYYKVYHHKMVDSYGHAVSYFDKYLHDGHINKKRELIQYKNPSKKPEVGDLIVMDKTLFNRFGHVAIVSEVTSNDIEIVQQNPGINIESRVRIPMYQTSSAAWFVDHKRVLGWLRYDKEQIQLYRETKMISPD